MISKNFSKGIGGEACMKRIIEVKKPAKINFE